MALERQSSALPPAQPTYILRGHAAQIHSVRFVRQNSRLLTGDADGWIVYWKLETKRALAVWKAHDGAILGAEEWGRDKIITHGRDNSLRIWQLRVSEETSLSTILPAEDAAAPRPKPWLLYTLPVNTLNFCAFSICSDISTGRAPCNDWDLNLTQREDAILVATPSTDDKQINVYQFPEEKLKYIVPKVSTTDSGMVMAVKLVSHIVSKTVLILSGYESGLTAVHQLPSDTASSVQSAQLMYLSQPHTQPILSLDVLPDARTYYTSSADAVVAAHRIPELPSDALQNERAAAHVGPSTTHENVSIPVTRNTDHDVTASTPPSPEITNQNLNTSPKQTSLTHSPSLSFSKLPIPTSRPSASNPGGLSSLLSTSPSTPNVNPTPPLPPPLPTIQPPHKSTNTKHSGQQSLRIRSDGRIFATAGWDARIRIYSSKTLKEVAVLKWHKEGVYAVDFAQVLEPSSPSKHDVEFQNEKRVMTQTGLEKVQRQREQAMQVRHWVVAGDKAGKVSLWDVF